MFLFFILIIRSTENFAQKKLWFFKYIVNSDIDLVTREWIFGYLELSRKIGFLKEASLEQKFSSYLAPNFLMIFHIILIIPKNENKSLVQLAIKTIYSTCHFKNLFFSGMPNPSLIINAFFYQSVDCTVSSDGEFAEAVLSLLSLVEPGSETSSSCSMAG